MSSSLTWLRSHPEFSSENSQELKRLASLATRIRNKKRDNLWLLPRTNSLDSTIEVELKTRVHDAGLPIGGSIGNTASASIQEASNVSVQETSNNTFIQNVPKKRRSKQRRKQNQATYRKSSNRPSRYMQTNRPEGYSCACGLPLGHAGLCPFNSTEEARKEVLKGVVVKPMPLVPDVQRLIELHKLHAAGNATRQEQDGGVYNCGNCGPVTRPHPCPFKPCPVCGRRMRDHNNNTFCPNYQRKANTIRRIRVSRKCTQGRSVIHEAWTKIHVENTRKRRHL
jgi:hypothetical protein